MTEELLDHTFNYSTKVLEVKNGDTVLISIPFKSAAGPDPCLGCGFGQFCEESIFGSKDIYFMKDFCRKAPNKYYPDLYSLGVDAKKFYNSIRGKIIKKLPKPKKI